MGEIPGKGIERKSQVFVASIRSESLISGPGRGLLGPFTHGTFCSFAPASIGEFPTPSKPSNVVTVAPARVGFLLDVTHKGLSLPNRSPQGWLKRFVTSV